MLSVLIFKNTGSVAVVAGITILWKNDIGFSSCRVSRLRTGLLWLRNEAAGQMSYPGMCRRAVDHTVYSWLLSHGPYLQTATWLLDSWLGPAITVSSFLPQHPPHSFSLFKSWKIYILLNTFSFLVSIHPPFILFHSLFPPSGNKIKRWVSQRKDKKLVSNNMFLIFILSAKIYTFQDNVILNIKKLLFKGSCPPNFRKLKARIV